MEEWQREPRGNAARYLPLSGEKGYEILIFGGPPTKTESRLQEGKTEWHFPAWRAEIGMPVSGQEPRCDWEEVIVTESGDNFLAALTVFQGVHGWNQPASVSWQMRSSTKGRKYKSFTIVTEKVPNLPRIEG